MTTTQTHFEGVAQWHAQAKELEEDDQGDQSSEEQTTAE